MPRITIDEQIQEVKREIAMRYTVYGRRVESGKMTQAVAARLIEIMQAVLDTLEEHKHCRGLPDSIVEALNSGDGSYRP